jgi:hypothetical protein
MESPTPTLTSLKRASLDDLERIYAEDRALSLPRGRFRGVFLGPVRSRAARRPWNRLMYVSGFQLPRFGVDFDRRRWWFHLSSLQVGRFEPRIARSRWRDTDTVALHYEASRLPGLVKRILYDEVKPLGPDLCLCIGGLNRERDEGDLFFFALTR